MADILIRGMEMPKDGRITIQIGADGAVYFVEKCTISAEKYEKSSHTVPLPEGHGDLIERKRLDLVPDYKNVRNGIKHIVKETKQDGKSIAGISIELLEQTLVALDELRSVRRYFENAPTIVPAEGSDN